MMVNKAITVVAGMCGAAFITYCIYFDRKRRSDPNFKKKLRERRRKQNLTKEKNGPSTLPDLKDTEAIQKFLFEELELAEKELSLGDIEKGVDHLTRAAVVCGQPQQLLQVLQLTLPPAVYQMLLIKLSSVKRRMASAQSVAEDAID